ncbi:TonB-dependent receptor plug domain-containing protein [Pseudomaricurvus sp.]|uniref:TonB-dependent receptor plug domain-containing protein n=1 Tax=Pseudomaricurvus sp. TaxID=2004510 RepID=UPI003F6D2E93
MYKQTLLAAALAGLTSLPSQAEIDKSSSLEEMVVTAHRIPVQISRIGSSVSVLSAADIEAKGQLSAADLLRTLPGIAVSNTGGMGKQTTLRIRGEEGYRTVVYVDGVKISDPTGTQVGPRFAHLMTSEIERIEVLRGPQGMMYGADAGGVVNITTKRPTQALEGDVSAEYGRYDTRNLSANLRGKVESFDYSISASDVSTDGFNARDDDTVLADDDGYDNTSLNASLGWDATEALRFELDVRDVDSYNEYDGSFGSTDRASDYEQTTGLLRAIYEGENHTQQLSYSANKVDRQLYTDGLKTYVYEGTLDTVSYLGSFKLSEQNTLVLGVDDEKQRDKLNHTKQDQLGIYAEWQGQFTDQWSYSAGVRHDDNDAFGEHTTYRLTTAYVQSLSDGNYLKYKASYGTGFRAPSLYEQNYNANSVAKTVLTEETSEGFDVGVELHTASGHLFEVVYFNQEIDDAIDFDVVGYTGYMQEDGLSRSKGVELNSELVLNDHLSLLANATYNDTATSTGEQRARRPRQVFNVGLQAMMLSERLRVNADVRGSYNAIDNDGSKLDEYEVLNVSATYFVMPQMEVYVRGENVMNADYQEVNHYNTSKAALYGGVRYRF